MTPEDLRYAAVMGASSSRDERPTKTDNLLLQSDALLHVCRWLLVEAQDPIIENDNLTLEADRLNRLIERLGLLAWGPKAITTCREWQAMHDDWQDRKRQAAALLPEVDPENLKPAEPNFHHYGPPPLKLIGRRGRAAAPDSALKGAAVRDISAMLPARLRDDYALIADMCRDIGITTTRQAVRSILLRGRT